MQSLDHSGFLLLVEKAAMGVTTQTIFDRQSGFYRGSLCSHAKYLIFFAMQRIGSGMDVVAVPHPLHPHSGHLSGNGKSASAAHIRRKNDAYFRRCVIRVTE
jgi:hypothetical protein